MPTNKKQHFVPQHYLRLFGVPGTELIVITRIDPYKFIGTGGISGQCQQAYFYGDKDSLTDALLTKTEEAVSTPIATIASTGNFDMDQCRHLRFFAVQLYLRTRQAAEDAKALPRAIANQFIVHGIEKGLLPAPIGGWRPEMMDFEGVPQLLIGRMMSCFFETLTLRCKLLHAPTGSFFLTSDNPCVALNQYAAQARGILSCVGFSQAGFQLLLPLSPSICVFIYDGQTYKVGGRSDRLVAVSKSDVETINSMQIQSAQHCLYSHSITTEREILNLIDRYGRLRRDGKELVERHQTTVKNQELVVGSSRSPVLVKPWEFCKYVRRPKREVGERRDPAYTALLQELDEDIEHNPGAGGVTERLGRLARAAGVNVDSI